MEYRIVETEQASGDWLNHVSEIGHYDSAYAAMRVMRNALTARDARARNWYLLDPVGRILIGPDDLDDLDDDAS